MAISRADFVQETTTTTGTGTYSLGGALSGRQSFIDGNTTGSTVRYSVTDNTDWEVAEGIITDDSPDTLTRATILASSNSNSAVNWGAGDKIASQVYTADEAISEEDIDTLYNGTNVVAKAQSANTLRIGDSNTEHFLQIRQATTGLDGAGNSDVVMQIESASSGSFESIIRKVSNRGGIAIGHDDSLMLGSGEAADTMITNLAGTAEDVYLGADDDVVQYAGLQNGWANRVRLTLSNGSLSWESFGTSDDELDIINTTHGGRFRLASEDSGGVLRFLFSGDPDATTDIFGAGTRNIRVGATTLGFYNSVPVSKPTVTGSRGGNVALADLLTELENLGLITDSTT